MRKQFKAPEWRGTSLDSPITKCAIPLFAVHGDEIHPSGTACLIAAWLAITARHVVEDHFEHFAGRPPGERDQSEHRTLTYVVPGNGEPAIPLFVQRTWFIKAFDLAVLHLVPAAEMNLQRVWDRPILSLLPPREGTRIAAFGYPNSEVGIVGAATREIHMDATTTTGTVLEVHHDRRDSARLAFPCYRTDARFDGGMSGGPVFDDDGHLCGVICSNLPPSAPQEEHVSYVSTLWPLLAIAIDAPWDQFPAGTSYPLYEYARAKIIDTVGLQHLSLEKTPTGTDILCSYDRTPYGCPPDQMA